MLPYILGVNKRTAAPSVFLVSAVPVLIIFLGQLSTTQISSNFQVASPGSNLIQYNPPMPNLIIPDMTNSNSQSHNHTGNSDKITKLALNFQELSPDSLKQFPLTKRSLQNELNSLSKQELVKFFDKLIPSIELTSAYPFLYALSGLSLQNFKILSDSPLFLNTIGCQLEELGTVQEILTFLSKLSVVQQGYLLTSVATVAHDVHNICYSGISYFDAPTYALPSIDFTVYLSSLLSNATLAQIKEIPLTEYPPTDLAKTVFKLSKDKREYILSVLSKDKRDNILNILNTFVNNNKKSSFLTNITTYHMNITKYHNNTTNLN